MFNKQMLLQLKKLARITKSIENYHALNAAITFIEQNSNKLHRRNMQIESLKNDIKNRDIITYELEQRIFELENV